jgi:hypothetical protein
MGLTALKSVRLEDAKLTGLFTKHRTHWFAMAEHAFEYTQQFVDDTGEEVRPDDLIPILQPALELDSKLRDFLEKGKLSQIAEVLVHVVR